MATASHSLSQRDLLLRMLAPYFAVLIFWIGLSNAWLTIAAYHAQILFWWSKGGVRPGRSIAKWQLLVALPTIATGPLTYFVLPLFLKVSLSDWLAAHHLAGIPFLLMIPYYGFVHPILEQLHWDPLRRTTPWAHGAFAGYHILVLVSLLKAPGLLLCFVILAVASLCWSVMSRRDGSLAAPMLSHILADFGMVLAAWLMN